MSISPNPKSSSLRSEAPDRVDFITGLTSFIFPVAWKTGKSSAAKCETYTNFQFFLSMTGWFDKLITFIGTHLSHHIDVITQPTIMFLGMVLEVIGSTRMVLPRDNCVLLGNLPHTKWSTSGKNNSMMELDCPNFTRYLFMFQRVRFDITSKKCPPSSDDCASFSSKCESNGLTSRLF